LAVTPGFRPEPHGGLGISVLLDVPRCPHSFDVARTWLADSLAPFSRDFVPSN